MSYKKITAEEKKRLLIDFLSLPIDSADEVFDRFALLDGAQYIKGEKTQARFLYIPGTRKDRVLLVAHADTVWDIAYTDKNIEQKIKIKDSIISGTNPDCGIGADDRSGCAMLYALRNSGHSLLIMDSEEHNKYAHILLKEKHKNILKELNRHQYMLEIDLSGTGLYSSNPKIANTKKFETFIENSLNLKSTPRVNKLGTDITQFCTKICGVNISCAYAKQHSPNEFINIEKWLEILDKLEKFLTPTQPKFKNSFVKNTKNNLIAFIPKTKIALKRSLKKLIKK